MATTTSLNVFTATTGHETLSYEVRLSEGERAVTMKFEDFNRQYFEMIKDKLSPLLNTVISNLLRSRDYLGLQLNLEFGNISNDQYEQLELDFLKEPVQIEATTLKNDLDILMRLSNKVFNAEEISTMFNCPLETAENAIGLLIPNEDY